MGSSARHRTVGVLLLAALVAACGPAARPALEPDPSKPRIAWPEAPKRARVQFVASVAGPEDLGVKPSFWARLGTLVTGKPEQRFVRPTGLAATAGRIYVADPGAQAVWTIDLVAGRFRTIGHADGHPLVSPVAVALAPNDGVFVADSFLGKVLAYDPTGKLTGAFEGPGLRRPAGLAYDARRDRLYVADSAAHTVWVLTGGGRLVGTIGRRGTGNAEFNFPTHVAVDRHGGLYVTDALGFRVQMFDAEGAFLGTFGQHGDSSGDFASPKGVAVDSDGHVHVVDALFDAVQIFDRGGRYLLTFGARGQTPGKFWLPGGLFIDARDRLYVADAYNRRIQVFQYLAGADE